MSSDSIILIVFMSALCLYLFGVASATTAVVAGVAGLIYVLYLVFAGRRRL